MNRPATRELCRPLALGGMLALALGVALAVTACAETLYLQPFINTAGTEDSSLRDSWYTHYGSGTAVKFSALGKASNGVPNVAPVPPVEPADVRGYMMGWGPSHSYGSPSGADHLFWTDLITLYNSASLTTMSWIQQNTSTADEFRPALRVDDQWYVADAGYASASTSTWESKTFSFSGATWKLLDFEVDSVLDVGAASSLPNGQVTGTGLYVPSMTNHMRIDNFEIDGPEDCYGDATRALYREIFPADTVSRPIVGTVEGWKVHYDNGAAYDAAEITYKTTGGTPALPAVHSNPQETSLAVGYVYNSNDNMGKDFLYWTDEYQIAGAENVIRIQWYQSNTVATDEFRVALRIGDVWYVSNDGFTTATGATLCINSSSKGPTWTRNELSLGDTTWQILDFTEDVELALSGTTVGSLPTGTAVTAWGLYSPNMLDAQRLDDFTITGIPEPGTAALVLGALMSILAWRRQKP